MKLSTYALIISIIIMVLGGFGQVQGATYTSIRTFDSSQGISNTSYAWHQCIPDLPDGVEVETITVELRSKIYAWPSSGRVKLVCSDTTPIDLGDPLNLICTFSTATHPNSSSFYTRQCTLQANQLNLIANDKCIYMSFAAEWGTTYYLDYCKVTVTTATKVADPAFSPLPGLYASPQQVSLNCGTDGALIRFTTDGAEPEETSTLYSGPIEISENTTLRARAFKEGMLPSEVVTVSYIIEQVNESKLYLRDNRILSEQTGSPVPWVKS